ncbi:MAG: type VI secretion system baseplate subunit TssE, partial [Variovorax sp.]
SHNRIGLQIRGMLWAQPVPLEFLMRSRIDLEEGRIEIEDLAHPNPR